MLIETITGKTFTPADACAWALKKGYKAPNQGTYYSYFTPQFKAFGIACEQLNTANLYGNKNSPIHQKAFDLLKQGYYLIACMGKGLWTSSGHFIVVWWEDGKVRINDPASTKTAKLNGDLNTFKSQVKYYFAVDARKHNGNGKAVADTKAETVKAVKVEAAKSFVKAYAKTWKTTANLNMRAGAGTDKPIITTLKKGASFSCYGYYTAVNGTVWLYGVADGKTGFCSKTYLK